MTKETCSICIDKGIDCKEPNDPNNKGRIQFRERPNEFSITSKPEAIKNCPIKKELKNE